jgi:hypothetical protein
VARAVANATGASFRAREVLREGGWEQEAAGWVEEGGRERERASRPRRFDHFGQRCGRS